jgi:PAS domain S-box-containing protein
MKEMPIPQTVRQLDVLIVEDSAEEAQLLLLELERAGFAPRFRRVCTEGDLAAALDAQPWDVVLCDYTMPELRSEAALALVREKSAGTPVLLVSGGIVDEAVVAAVRAGARDIVGKDRLARLAPAVERELQTAQERRERRALMQQVQTSERRFRALIENSFDGICLLSANASFLYASPSAERILGCTAAELLGRNALELVTDEDRPLAQERLVQLLAMPGQTLTVQVRLDRSDGRVIWTEHVGTNLLDEPSVGAVVVNFRDITARTRMEQILRENEARAQGELAELEHIYDTAPVGLCLLGADLRYLRINERLAAMNGVPACEHLGRSIWDVMPETAPAVAPLLARILESGQPVVNWQFRTGKPAPAPRDYLASYYPVKTAGGKILGVAAVVQDITELKRVERALRESEQRFRALIESSSDGFVLLDAAGKVLYSGPPVLGYAHQEFLGRKIFEVVHPDERPRLHKSLFELYRQPGRVITIEVRVRHRDGSWRWVECVAKNLSADPVIGGIVVNYRDVTERKRLEEQLRQTQKLESIGVLAGGVAHDFNNLLTGVLGNAHLALDALPPEHPASSYIADVAKAAESAASLTQQLLAYSGKGRFVIEPMDLSDLTRRLMSLVRTSIPSGVQLQLDLAADLPAVEGDPGQLQQLVMNLVINAAESIGEGRGGAVRVATGLQVLEEEHLPATLDAVQVPPGHYVFLQVQDNGAGMDPEIRSKIFDPFFTTKFSGRGLGLSAVLGIVRGHRGAIQLESVPGQGTTFRVLFPPSSRPPVRPVNPVVAPRPPRATGTILIADDEDIVRRTAQKVLERQGYSVLVARNGREAVEILRQRGGEVAAVLLDLTMPVLGGEEAVRELRSIRPEVKIVLSSGFDEAEVTRRFAGQGLSGFIQKPYTLAQLAEKIRAVLE